MASALMAPRTAILLASVPLALLAMALVVGIATPQSRPVALVQRQSSPHMALQAQQRFARFARNQMLAEEEAAEGEEGEEGEEDAECVSWRGCSQSYDSDKMDIHNQVFYDRFDNYPTAWDPSPAARYVKDLYPNGWPVYEGEEPGVIVGGDPAKKYPFNAYGTPYDGVYDTYRSPFTYTY